MRLKFRRYKAHLTKWKVLLLLLILVLIISVYIFQVQLQPIIREYASVQARNAVYTLINEQVENTLASQSVTYDSLVTLVRDSDGRVCALTTNIAEMNSFKTKVTSLILEENQKLGQASFEIPLGILTGNELLSGYGPDISVRLTPVSAIESSYSNSFSSAGINQTRHQIMMNFSADVGLLLPGYTDKTRIDVQICIAETVIVGTTPQFFASMGYSDQTPVQASAH